MLQLISNDKLKSVEHRVVANHKGQGYQLHASSLLITTHHKEYMAPSRSYFHKITPLSIGIHHYKILMLITITRDLVAILLFIIFCCKGKKEISQDMVLEIREHNIGLKHLLYQHIIFTFLKLLRDECMWSRVVYLLEIAMFITHDHSISSLHQQESMPP
ncbi:uncharacterized protein DS421_5g166860 [Arachis hypogaea]|nr:uncharacterized protein DS421_5g166860 [Arachis hypogaea]